MSESSMLAAALSYAGRGWPILPLIERTKDPATRHGVKDATTDTATIRRWFHQWPNANIGLACNTLLAVDIDPRHGGIETFVDLLGDHPLPDTLKNITGRGDGGMHLIFKAPNFPVKNGEVAPGVDIKASGGYVVVPPSVHPDTGKPYQWADEEAVPSDLPDWLAAILRAAPKPSTIGAATGEGDIPEGKRNAVLASLAGSMRRRGMTPVSIEAALLAENASRCRPPLPDDEVRRIAASVGRYEPEQKRGQTNGESRPGMVWIPGTEMETMPAISRPNLIESILPGEGAVLMAADAKTGKTVLSLEMSLAVATGDEFLGRFPVQQGGAVYWMADDPNENRFILHYQRLTRGRSLPNFIAAIDRRPLIPDGIVELEKAVKQVDAKLVTIDCYSAIRARRRQGEDFVEAEYNELRILGEFAAKHHCVVNLLHHMSTVARGTGNLFNKIAGSFAMGAAPDGMIALQTITRTRTERVLLTQGRDLDCKPLVYARDEEGHLFLVAEGQLAECWDDIYRAFLGLNGEAVFTGKELAEAMGVTDRMGRYKCAELKNAGAVFEITGRRYKWDDTVLDRLTRVRRINRGGQDQ